ncbi:hypothetical protein B0H16DRAFT_1487473 [Mycena metata]|uniref:Uncharacterized protein n=1 Tax=Mycena metata TaxID=1033252 RepID=A0AAD7GG90_9AGAR|nr:hypothetical protein B0H16DRAFT_1487473 [Mycena metata]
MINFNRFLRKSPRNCSAYNSTSGRFNSPQFQQPDDEQIAQVVAREHSKLEQELEAQARPSCHQRNTHKPLPCSGAYTVFKAGGLERRNFDASSQLTLQADQQIAAKMALYRKGVQEQIEHLLQEKTLEFQVAQSTFKAQRDENASQWAAKIEAVETELRKTLALLPEEHPIAQGDNREPRSSKSTSTHVRKSAAVADGILKLRQNTPRRTNHQQSVRPSPVFSASSLPPPAALPLPQGRSLQHDQHQHHFRAPDEAFSRRHPEVTAQYPRVTATGTTAPTGPLDVRPQRKLNYDVVPAHPNRASLDFRSGKFLVPRGEQKREDVILPLQKAIRTKMQELLGIEYDHFIGDAIRLGHSTPLELSIGAYPSSLIPFRPCWDDLKGEWNQALGDLFLHCFKLEHPELVQNLAQREAYICKHFHQRLRTLRVALDRQARNAQGRITAMGRRSERRRAIYDKRETWTVDNQQALQPSKEPYPILLLYEMVKLLGTDGMSSESSEEMADAKLYAVVEKNWRHPDVIRLLRWIDAHWTRNVGRSTGKPFHERLRLPHGKAAVSLRFPIAGLPRNFYHPGWYNTLSVKQKQRLGAIDETPLPLYLLQYDIPPTTNAGLDH